MSSINPSIGMSMAGAVGVRLKALREYFGWSQRELAKRAGVPNSAISVIEQGSVSPSVLSLEKVLKGFPLSLQQFFLIDTSHTPSSPAKLSEIDSDKSSQLASSSDVSLQHHQATKETAVRSVTPNSRGVLVLLSGSATFYTVGACYKMEPESSIKIPAHIPYRIEPASADCSWLLINIPH